MKKKFLYILVAAIACGVLSVLAEIFCFNFRSLTLSETDYSVFDVAYTTEKTDDGKIKLDLEISDKYIRQLIINYSASKDIDYSINYTYPGVYGQKTEKVFNDIFEDTFTVAVTNLDVSANGVSILFDDTSEIKIDQISIDNDFHFNCFRAFFIFLALFALCFIFFFYKDGFCTEKIHIYFAIITFLLGLMFIVAQPAMNFFCWDDQIHFDRVVGFPMEASEYSGGEFNMSDGGIVNRNWPISTDSFVENQIRSEYLNMSNNDDEYTGNNRGFVFVNKVPYAPMAIGYHFAKMIGLPFTVCFYIGKIFNLLFYILCMSYAIKVLVTGKRLLAVIAMLPSNIFLASSYSYDSAVFAGIAIFIVNIINLLLSKNRTMKLDFKTAIVMIASATYACLAKAVYAPIMLLVALVPKHRFKNIKQSWLVKIGFMIIMILLGATLLLPTLDGVGGGDSRGGEVSVKDQTLLVISHPVDYASVIGDTAVKQFGWEFFSPHTITNFSWATSSVDLYGSNFYYVFVLLLAFVFFTDNVKNTLTKKQRCGILGVSLLIVVIIWTALYINFTSVGLATINGVQPRYFLPIIFPILFCLQIPGIQNKISSKYYNMFIFVIVTIIIIFMVNDFILIPYNS